jgi:L-2-hydroxyglutarate oxidase
LNSISRTYDVAIVGGGIVGLATAYQLSQEYPDKKVVILEKENRVAAHQTGRNSGVIHSGIYYKPGSLKATNCFAGRKALIEFCSTHGIKHEICGKVIVAVTESERGALQRIYERGKANGVACEKIGPERLRELEPHVAGVEALHVPEAGIVDYKGVANKLAEVITQRNGEIRLESGVVGIEVAADGVDLETETGPIRAKYLVNCAGLYADRIARMTGQEPGLQVVPFRGEYYELKPHAKHLCHDLIYPVPDPAYPFLGVHFTRMYDGAVECGPSAILGFAREGYTLGTINVPELWEILKYRGFRELARQHWRKGFLELRQSVSKKYYLSTLQRLIPGIALEDIEPVPSGVRAQALLADGSMADDFVILELPRVVNVCNAASPAATASLNVGKTILDRLSVRF